MNVTHSSVVFVRSLKEQEEIDGRNAYSTLMQGRSLRTKLLKGIKKNATNPAFKDWDEETFEENPFLSQTKFENGYSLIGELIRGLVVNHNKHELGEADPITEIAIPLCEYLVAERAEISVVGININGEIEATPPRTALSKLHSNECAAFKRPDFFPIGMRLGFKPEDNIVLKLILEEENGILSYKANFEQTLKSPSNASECKLFIKKFDDLSNYLKARLDEVVK